MLQSKYMLYEIRTTHRPRTQASYTKGSSMTIKRDQQVAQSSFDSFIPQMAPYVSWIRWCWWDWRLDLLHQRREWEARQNQSCLQPVQNTLGQGVAHKISSLLYHTIGSIWPSLAPSLPENRLQNSIYCFLCISLSTAFVFHRNSPKATLLRSLHSSLWKTLMARQL